MMHRSRVFTDHFKSVWLLMPYFLRFFQFWTKSSAPQRRLSERFEFAQQVSFRFYRVFLEAPIDISWSIGDFDFYIEKEQLAIAPSHQFKSAGMSAGSADE
jgi:hypothetical protein